MSHPITTTVTLAAASANNIALSQAVGGAGNLTLNGSTVSGGVATLDAPRRVGITSAGNDSGITFTVYGTSRSQQGGGVQQETITGANIGVAVTTQDFATVTRIAASAAAAGNVTAGTTATGSGPWVPWDMDRTPFQLSAWGAVQSGSPTWQVDITYDDVFGTWLPAGQPYPIAIALDIMNGQTADANGTITNLVRASRLTLTAVGSVKLVQQQARG